MAAIGDTRLSARGDSAVPGLVLAGGIVTAALLVLHYDSSALHRALGAIGIIGLAAVAAINFVAIFLCAAAWRGLVAGKNGVASYLWFRYTRNAAADLLGFIPAAGELTAVREMHLRGVDCHLAAASLIVDLTVQLTAQLAFTSVSSPAAGIKPSRSAAALRV